MYYSTAQKQSIRCVLGMDGIKSQGGRLEKEKKGRFGMVFVSVTQHMAPHASEINAYPGHYGPDYSTQLVSTLAYIYIVAVNYPMII